MLLPEELNKRNQKIIEKKGLPEQMLQLTEECAELIQAVSKYRRAEEKAEKHRVKEDLMFEITDVLVLLDQIMDRIGMSEEDLRWRAGYKISRQEARMNA